MLQGFLIAIKYFYDEKKSQMQVLKVRILTNT